MQTIITTIINNDIIKIEDMMSLELIRMKLGRYDKENGGLHFDRDIQADRNNYHNNKTIIDLFNDYYNDKRIIAFSHKGSFTFIIFDKINYEHYYWNIFYCKKYYSEVMTRIIHNKIENNVIEKYKYKIIINNDFDRISTSQIILKLIQICHLI
jgi:hypothetical protein